ncbi:MAG TPA: hypothetical protein VMD59_12775 [Acidimicrobiales bacterium]|nr:hypothetical protein [Acidimicrobiales bacterium]
MSNSNRRARGARRGLLQRSLAGASAAVLAGTLLVAIPSLTGTSAAASSSGGSTNTTIYCKSGATQIEFWDWVPGIYRMVDEFNKTHPSICVKLDDVGAGDTEYVKLTDAIKAGSGIPDVAEVEFDELPSYEITKSVVNLADYGADKYKSLFAPFAWSEVSQGSAVYAMPGDSGPMDLFCNSAVLNKYHITIGSTWASFATAAEKLHAADPSGYLASFDPEDMQYLVSVMAQDNAFPFSWNGGSAVTVNFVGPNEMAFANYWDTLFANGSIKAAADFQNAFWQDLNNGTYACWIASAWGPSYLAPNLTSKSLGDWRTFPLPQWTAGADVAANWGGSTYPVFSASKDPAAAATFSEWMNGTAQSWAIMKTAPSSLFPTYLPLLNTPSFRSISIPATGTTPLFNQAGAAASHVKAVSWPPFMTYFLALTTTSNLLNGKGTMKEDFATLQTTMVSYAKQQGFTVNT